MRPIQTHFSFTDPIYRAEIHVYVGSAESLNSRFKRRWGLNLDPKKHHSAESFRLTENDGGFRVYVIWVDYFDWRIGDQGSFIHEISHTVTKVFQDRGISGDEARAYYTEYLMKMIWSKLRPIHPKKKGGEKC